MTGLTSDQLAIGLAFVAVATLACLAPAQGDTWWLLRAGRDLWTTGHVPLTETFKGVVPFLASDFVRITLLVYFPIISLYLVHTLKQ